MVNAIQRHNSPAVTGALSARDGLFIYSRLYRSNGRQIIISPVVALVTGQGVADDFQCIGFAAQTRRPESLVIQKVSVSGIGFPNTAPYPPRNQQRMRRRDRDPRIVQLAVDRDSTHRVGAKGAVCIAQRMRNLCDVADLHEHIRSNGGHSITSRFRLCETALWPAGTSRSINIAQLSPSTFQFFPSDSGNLSNIRALDLATRTGRGYLVS